MRLCQFFSAVFRSKILNYFFWMFFINVRVPSSILSGWTLILPWPKCKILLYCMYRLPLSCWVSFVRLLCLWLYERTCLGVERTRVPPGPAGAGRYGQHLFSARSAVVRRRHCPCYHSRPQSCHRVRRQSARRPAPDARSTVSFKRWRLMHCVQNTYEFVFWSIS